MDGIGERAAPRPTMNPAGQSHEALKGMTDPAEPTISAEIAAYWRSMGQSLAQAGILLQQAVVGSESGWTGLAADGMRYRLGQVVDWALKSSDNFATASSAVEDQSAAVGEAKTRMPEPVPYDPAQMIKDAKGQGLWGMALLPDAMHAQYEKQKAAHEEAVRVVSARDMLLAMHAGSIPSFLAPPTLSDTGDPGIPGPGPGPGGGGSGGGGGAGGGFTGGGSGGGSGSGSGGGAPGPTSPAPIAPAPIGPIQPNPGLTNPDRYVPGPPTSVPSLPTTGVGTGVGAPGGSPGFGQGVGFVPNTGFGGGSAGGGAGTGGGGGRGPGSGAGAPGRGPGGATGMGPGATAGGPAAATRGAAGARGAAGMGGMPLGAGRGQGDEDGEHKRPTYLEEPDPEALFGTDEMTAPPVIGDE